MEATKSDGNEPELTGLNVPSPPRPPASHIPHLTSVPKGRLYTKNLMTLPEKTQIL